MSIKAFLLGVASGLLGYKALNAVVGKEGGKKGYSTKRGIVLDTPIKIEKKCECSDGVGYCVCGRHII